MRIALHRVARNTRVANALATATIVVVALNSSACDSATDLFVTNDSRLDVIVYINGLRDRRPPIFVKAGTEKETGGVMNFPIKTVDVAAVDASGNVIDGVPTGRFEFPGGGTRESSRHAVSFRLTGPPLTLEQIPLKPGQ